MKKTLLTIAILLVTTSAFAEYTIKINSWRRINYQDMNDTAAELCAQVTGVAAKPLTGSERAVLTVDPKHDPAHYVTLIAPGGQFCQVVNSYTGQIQVDVMDGGKTIVSSLLTK